MRAVGEDFQKVKAYYSELNHNLLQLGVISLL